MVRSLFRPAAVWGSMAVLAMTGTASAQWFPFGGGSSCNCGARPTLMGPAPITQSASYSSFSAAYNPVYQTAYSSAAVSCGQPIACTVTQPVQIHTMAVAPVQTVKVQAMQPVVHPVYDTVHVAEYQQVKQKVLRPVVETKMVSQTVTEMHPQTVQQTVNVPTVEYQTVTEVKQVQKQVGYWQTKTEAINKVSGCAYDNRPGVIGWMNRTGQDLKNAVTPNTRVSRTFVPQTMTCAVPTQRKVAIQGMKQVTYNVTSMVPKQVTRQVAVNQVRHVEEEVVAMKLVTVPKMMQVGTRISYQPVGGGTTASGPANSGPTALTPTPDPNASATRPSDRTAEDPDAFGRPNPKKISYPMPERDSNRGDVTESVIPTRPVVKTPSVIRVSQWVARMPSAAPQLDKSSAIAIAGNVQ